MNRPVKLIIIGCGARGTGYSHFAEKYPERAQVVAIAEPRDFYRNRVGDACKVPESMRFHTWEDVAKLPKMADAVLICTQDDMHEAPAIAFARLGYNILLEKPMAPTEDACRRIVKEVRAAGVMFAVCHVLRYTDYTRVIKDIIRSGKIGKLVSIEHLEPVGYWHQAHSFVRGNWRNEAESSPMLLAKSCHDVDWLRYIADERCTSVQSFGSLAHFRRECRPEGAADRCTGCPEAIEKQCPYSAIKIYLRDRVAKNDLNWPTNVLTPVVTKESVRKAIEEGPYGRCVYACDNDVVDHQVVNMLFASGATASFTMTAFAPHGGRRTRVFGTRGMAETLDSEKFTITDFLTDQVTEIDSKVANDGGILTAHGGGDAGLMESFISALENDDPSRILSGPEETLESHLMVFAAERSRKQGTVEPIRL